MPRGAQVNRDGLAITVERRSTSSGIALNPDMEIFTDGSSFVRDGKRKAGYAMVTAEQVLEAKSLPQGTSAQLAELVALT